MNLKSLTDNDVENLLRKAAPILIPTGSDVTESRRCSPWELTLLRRYPTDKTFNETETQEWTVAILSMISGFGAGGLKLSPSLYTEIFGVSQDWNSNAFSPLGRIFNHLGLSGLLRFECGVCRLTVTEKGKEFLSQHADLKK